MDHERFREWFSHVDELTTAQCKEVATVLSDPPEGAASLAAIELGVDDERRCPHCASAGAVSRGKARGLRRYRCKACGKTFGALTGTALSGLHHKERWLAFGASLGAGETIREAAERCGIAPSTAFRWRHRFLAAVRQAPDRLAGIVEADETFVLESRKGERKLDRKPRRRGGKARKRGLSREQVPVLVAADRAGATLSQTLPALNAKSVKEALEPVVARDALLVSDANRCYPPVAAALDIPHESINGAAGERVRGALHIQTVNSRHSQIKGFLRGFRASPPSTSTAISGGSISSNSATSHRRERVSRRQWPDHAYASLIEPKLTYRSHRASAHVDGRRAGRDAGRGRGEKCRASSRAGPRWRCRGRPRRRWGSRDRPRSAC